MGCFIRVGCVFFSGRGLTDCAEFASGRIRSLSGQVFRECDCGGKGYLSGEDLKMAVVTIFGYKPSKMETDRMMAPALGKHLPGMSLDQFLSLMSSKVATQDGYEQTRQIFTAFDVHCRSFLSREDFKRAFASVAPHLPEQTAFEAFSLIFIHCIIA
uniref:EF-hand calcium-binding domain-containing protein 11-like n=1 Tax=Callorhinchus milii TaxID=7868 RepID=A0A4W3GLE5_CALMI